jgi:hypothetical protein
MQHRTFIEVKVMKKIEWSSFLLVLIVLLAVPDVFARDILSQIHPYITVRGEYNDNLYLSKENKKRDFITTITPGVKFDNMDAKSGIVLDINAGPVFYYDHSNLNYVSANAILDAKYLTTSHWNFYLREAFTRSDSPREREYFTTTADNKYYLATETTRSPYWRNVISPTVEYQFGPESRVGLTYRNTIYQATAAGSENSMENYVSPFVVYWLNRQHGISASYEYTNGHFEKSPDFNNHRVNGSYMYRFTPKAMASLNGAYSRYIYSTSFDYDVYDASVGISYIFTPTLSAAFQIGYYWAEKLDKNGITFKGNIIQKEGPRTTYVLTIQGGYTYDYFTSQNLGFREYYRATGSVTHFLDKRFSIGCLGSVEWSQSDPRASDPYDPGLRETIWGAGANASYYPFKWLKASLEYNFNMRNTNYYHEASYEYIENRVMLSLTATY